MIGTNDRLLISFNLLLFFKPIKRYNRIVHIHIFCSKMNFTMYGKMVLWLSNSLRTINWPWGAAFFDQMPNSSAVFFFEICKMYKNIVFTFGGN